MAKQEPLPWKWTPKRDKVANLIAQHRCSDAEVCRRKDVDIAPVTLCAWKKYPEFLQRVAQYQAEYRAAIRAQGIALLERRIETYLEDFAATEKILQERGQQTSQASCTEALEKGESVVKNIKARKGEKISTDSAKEIVEAASIDPYAGGASTGYIVRDVKNNGQAVYAFDAALMRERRELRKQAAQELGQWTEKTEIGGTPGQPIEHKLTAVSTETLEKLEQELATPPQVNVTIDSKSFTDHSVDIAKAVNRALDEVPPP